MKVVAIVQARMGSTRLPKKVMKPIVGSPMIELLLKRLSRAGCLDGIVVATSDLFEEKPLVDHVISLGFQCFQGREQDVLDRYVKAARACDADVIVRITGDCPLVDPVLVDQAVRSFFQSEVEYFSNIDPRTYPDGLDIEVFSIDALERAAAEATSRDEREHVTPYMRLSGLFGTGSMQFPEDLSQFRWTVDKPEDFVVISQVFEEFAPQIHFTWQQVLDLRCSRPEIFEANEKELDLSGTVSHLGQQLWRRAKNVIPGGNMLLSKRSEMFLPGHWPSYFSKAKGCRVWDLEGTEYIDMSIMGVGTNSLGYGHPEIDDAVKSAVGGGNMSTLNCPEEVWLAERLVELHPWADMVRFARSGGEANAIAIRIARASAGRDKVAICGYHGWHDWYLSANLANDENLDGHLLPGLEPKGVPENLKGTVFPFTYNNLDELEQLVNLHDIGVIKMEVQRNMAPENNFLGAVRELASARGIVLIFDECTSGFRQTYGGLHKQFEVEPDIAVFGKALGNGYAITATIGRREVMEAAQNTFISSTFWTERIGPAAALKTLEVMERLQSWRQITAAGLIIRDGWQGLADKHGLDIEHFGLPALAGFSIRSSNALSYKTLITQEMLRMGYLASNSVYVCTEHTQEIIESYLSSLDKVFALIRDCEDGRSVDSLLAGPVCHDGFKRLN